MADAMDEHSTASFDALLIPFDFRWKARKDRILCKVFCYGLISFEDKSQEGMRWVATCAVKIAGTVL